VLPVAVLVSLALAGAIAGAPAPDAPTAHTTQLTASERAPEGLAASDWAAIRAAHAAARHAVVRAPEGHAARNPGQQWNTTFDARGFITEPDTGDWQWGLQLERYGFPGREVAIAGPPAVTSAGSRLAYRWDARVEEWFVNDARGL